MATVIPFADEEEAVRLANDTIYGLSGSIWTRDGARALRVARAIETGVLSINSNTSVRVATPFGGFKQSGYGRELGPHALDAYTEVKSIYYATVMSGRLEGKVCVITGAAGGIGAATARAVRRARARAWSASTCSSTTVGELCAPGRPDRRARGAGALRPRARGARPDRRAVQQRRHLADRRRLGARHRRSRRGSASRTPTCAASSSAASTGSRTCSTAAAAR